MDERTEIMRDFSKSEAYRGVLEELNRQIKLMEQSILNFSITATNEKEFMVLKYRLEGAKTLMATFQIAVNRLGALDSDGRVVRPKKQSNRLIRVTERSK